MTTEAPYPQLTVKAIILGILLSVILAGANAYLGLFAGMTVSASIPAAVISMAVLKMFRESNILENNIVQTAASAGESIAAGVIFTIPALLILGTLQFFNYWWVTAIAGLGGLLGVLFTIPLRRSLIIDQGLKFPEGTATAEVLRVGEDPSRGVRDLAIAAGLGGLMKLGSSGLKLWSETAATAAYAGKSTIAYVGTNISPALLSVGYIVGLNIAVLVFLGGAISWYVGIPIFSTFFLETNPGLMQMHADGANAVDLSYAIWSQEIRYLGVGAMLVGGIWALISMRSSILGGITAGFKLYSRDVDEIVHHTERDTPMKWVLVMIGVCVLPIFLLYQEVTGTVMISIPMTILMVIAGFLFSSVAGYMAGLVGSSNNPISGITIATILFASLMLVWLMPGTDASLGPAAAILIGGVVCCAAAIAGDNMQDLKAGYIVGSTPWKQQRMQGIGVASAVLLMFPILDLLNSAYGIGVPTETHPNPLLAPQATLMAAVAQGVFHGGLPWTMVALGGGVGVVIIAVDEWLRARGASFRAPVLAVAVGIYLPLELSVPIFAGGLIAHAAKRYNDRVNPGEKGERNMRTGMLFAAGLITGEALVGILMAIPIVLSGQRDVLAIAAEPFGGWPGLLGLAALAVVLLRVAKGPKEDAA